MSYMLTNKSINMFPHTCTIYHKHGDDEYKRQVLTGVCWYGPQLLKLSGKGVEATTNATVVIPKAIADTAEIAKGYYVVNGTGPEITSMRELEQYEVIAINSVSENYFGRPNDNKVITGV